ncbi:helix-turn-helix transcriptional regulator [Candidatus Woesearchaeota archaeon]|nr:helix-turn-helix transcriptional regulator [Candidatus Woesearchaeota archaeon]
MNEDCTIYKITNIVSKRWTIPILLEIYKSKNKSKRYSEIKNSLMDITPKILSSRLKELELEGFVEKKVEKNSFPVKCEYSLTESGSEFIPIIQKIKEWSLKNKFDNKHCKKTKCEDCQY